MAVVTITLQDTGLKDVSGTMAIEGHNTGDDIQFSTAVLFGEAFMRALPSEDMWKLARGLVPEAFDDA